MPRIYTVGHSTLSAADFLALLDSHRVQCLTDVRRFPASRRHPHFAREPLAATLSAAGITYVHEPDLGGYRGTPEVDSPNTAWQSPGFRAYADHMDSAEFRAALERLIERAGRETTTMMCAEAVPWRCHRQLISDALVARGFEVVHILGAEKVQAHEINPRARPLEDGRLVYPAPPLDQMGLFTEG